MRIYDENGKIDKFATFVNRNEWVIPVIFISALVIVGIIENIGG